jgi:RNA-binding protein YhbY
MARPRSIPASSSGVPAGFKRGQPSNNAKVTNSKMWVTASSDAVVEHVRRHLAEHELVKVRIRADSRTECEQAAAVLAARVPRVRS